MPASCFNISVHIPQVLAESLLQAFARLPNVLLATPGQPTGDGIADVGRQAVHLRGQGHLVVCGSSLEGLPWLDVRAC